MVQHHLEDMKCAEKKGIKIKLSWVRALKFSLILSSNISGPRLSNKKINCTKPSCFRCFVAIWHRGSWVPTQKSKIKRLVSDLPGSPGGKCRCLYMGFNRRSTSLKWPCQKSWWIIRITLTKKQITLAAQFPQTSTQHLMPNVRLSVGIPIFRSAKVGSTPNCRCFFGGKKRQINGSSRWTSLERFGRMGPLLPFGPLA